MRFPLSLALALLGGLTPPARLAAQPKLPPNLVAPTDPLSPADERKTFTVPAGFDVQLVASEPDIQKPMQMAFDAKGRLWVTTSHLYPFPAEQGKGTDKLFVLSDIDPKTGKAAKVQVFATDLNIPIGVLPLPDCKSCIVSSTGEIRKYTDTDGDGKADKSEVLYTGFGFRDTHGMTNSFTLMPDGWVYACHGFNNDSSVKGTDGHEVKMSSGHTFRFRPDGSRIEVFTHGQVNPFGIAVDPWFNLYTADCHSKPITQLVPGAYYQSFGKPHDGLGFAPHVTAHPHKSTGLCGLAWYDADQFPKEYKGQMFLGDVVSNCISLDKIVWKGSTPVAVEQPDFLTSTDRWFRPTDIKLGPDGALYVSDFYNKIIGHYEVDLKHPGRDKDHGRIWRIVWTGKGEPGASAAGAAAPKFAFTDLTKQDVREVYELLNSPNIAVRILATNQLIHRSEDMRRALKTGIKTREPFSDRGLAHAAWQGNSQSIDTSGITGTLTTFKDRHTPFGIAHELRMAGAESKWDDKLRAAVIGCFKDGPIVQRAAVEAVIFHPHADFVAPLVEVLKKCPADDTLLRQAARIALRNCLRGAGGWGEANKLVAADAKNLQTLVPVTLATRTKEAAVFLGSQFNTKKYQLKRYEEVGLSFDEFLDAVEFIGRYGTYEEFRTIIDIEFGIVGSRPAKIEPALQTAVRLLRGIQAAGGKGGGTLLDDTRGLLDAGLSEKAEPKDARLAVQLLAAHLAMASPDYDLKFLQKHYQKQLAWWMSRASAPAEVRGAAFEVATKYMLDDLMGPIGKVLSDRAAPSALRDKIVPELAADPKALAHVGIRDGIRDAMKHAPYRTASAIAMSLAVSKTGAELLLKAVKENDVSARILQEKAIIERLRAHAIPDFDKQVATLTKGLPPADARLAGLIKARAAGFASAKLDKAEGAKLFTKHCAACHKINDVGGKIAPQLDGIGLRGPERLLEDVLDPNRNVDQAFRARSITTTDDRTITALMLRVEGEVLVVADLEGKEKQIPLKEIAQNRETMLSAMPANFGDVVPEADFYNIVAYLLDQKAKDPPKK